MKSLSCRALCVPYLINFDFGVRIQGDDFFEAIPSSLFYDIYGLYRECGQPVARDIFVVELGALSEHVKSQ